MIHRLDYGGLISECIASEHVHERGLKHFTRRSGNKKVTIWIEKIKHTNFQTVFPSLVDNVTTSTYGC